MPRAQVFGDLAISTPYDPVKKDAIDGMFFGPATSCQLIDFRHIRNATLIHSVGGRQPCPKLQDRSPEDDESDAEVDHQSGDVDQRGDERR